MPKVDQLLSTKFYIPPARPELVSRPRLLQQLNDGLHRKLTLISAPAGFGKTTLVSEWIMSSRQPAAWLSLDESDNEPARFLFYFISALQTISPKIGSGILDVLQSPQLPPIESILTTLLNEIANFANNSSAGSGQSFILVLDDYHLVDSKSIDNALSFLIEHLPPQLHLIITTREDPALPIPRLRARNQLVELREADLRFTLPEATEFLNQVMDLNLSMEEVAALETRTEGWIAGLQLAALSMRGQKDVHGFILAFAGDHRYIVDYLAEEVLQRQPEPIRNFLLQTSILDRLNASLCNAVTSRSGSKAILEQLQRGNLFLIPLDDKRHWYRYHHLFADVLHMHLMAEQPEQVSVLHCRASEWYAKNGSISDAVLHALVGEDFERAAELVELVWPEIRRSRQETMLLGWLRELPDELLRNRPVLSAAYAHTLLATGEIKNVENRLRDAERWLDANSTRSAQSDISTGAMIIVDNEAFLRLPGTIALARTGLALAQGNLTSAMTYAQRALDLAPADDHLTRGGAMGFRGLISWSSGDLDIAYRTFAEGMTYLETAGNLSDTIGGSLILADIRMAQGRLHEAMHIYERGLKLAKAHNGPALRGAADMYVGISELEYEHNDLHVATQHLLRCRELGEYNGFPQNPYRWRVAMARIQQAQGDPDGALDLLNQAEKVYAGDFSPNVRPIAALKARVWIAQGKLGEALDWAREQRLSADDELNYLREYEHITLARLLLAQHKNNPSSDAINAAIGLMGRLLKAAEEGGRMRSVIEILILQTLTHQMQENTPAALTSLERALPFAEPEGYVRMFVDEGANMAALLREVVARGIMPDYTDKLLSAFDEDQGKGEETPLSVSPTSSSLIEPLSQRELDILRLFKTELSGPEIAQELVIALSTVRTHTKSIYSKLNVNNRRGAIKRAMELGLI